jgi:hypothetical protein
LAQIAAAVDRGNVKHPKKVKLKNYILKFGLKKKIEEDKEVKTQNSKNFWKALVMGAKKRPLPKKVKQIQE